RRPRCSPGCPVGLVEERPEADGVLHRGGEHHPHRPERALEGMQDEAERLERERAEKSDIVTLTEDDGAWRVDAAEAEPTVGKPAAHRPTVRKGEAHRAARLEAEGVPHRPW